MSKKVKNAGSFSYKTQQTLPKLKIKTEWDLKKHFYTSERDPQIELDAKKYESAIRAFCKKYKDTAYTKDSKTLLQALKDYEKLADYNQASKIIRYLMFRFNLNVNDVEANKKMNLYSERFRKLSNEMLFFGLSLGKIPTADQKKYLNDESLKKYHYFLEQTFISAKHQLTEPEEKILRLRSNTSSDMWAEAVEKILSNRTITFKGKQMAVPEAIEQIDMLNWSDKGKLWELILDQMVAISEFAEHELTAIVTHEKVSDQLRGYKKPYSATVLSYENNERSVEALVEAISTEGFKLSQKFYKLKAKLHNRKTIPYANKYDPIGKMHMPDFETSVEVCRDVFYGVKKEYGEIFDTLLSQGQTDVYPKRGKRGGAFMAGTIGLPTFVFLNHTANFKSLETLAHEMGHAVHNERSKLQPTMYQEYSTTTAETASTLFEQLVLDRILPHLNKKEQVIFLHNKISRDIATVQRQIAFFNFELKMHEHIRTEGLATKEELAKFMKDCLSSYLGPAVDVTERDGYSYVYIPHVRYGFYVYTYSYGHLMSNLMAQRYQADNSYIEQIDKFLTSGGVDTVENIFKSIGINASRIETFKESLDTQKHEIALLEKLTK